MRHVQPSSLRRGAGILAAAALAGAGAVLVAGDPASSAPVTETFEFTGAAQEFVVPAEVCEVTITALGAQGGDAVDPPEEEPVPAGPVPTGEPEHRTPGGLGGAATATIPVTPGETLQVYVGGAGGEGIGPVEDAEAGPGPLSNGNPGGEGGFNGGADGGAAGDDPGGGGGGASDVRLAPYGLAERIVAAGGGGGAGGGNEEEDAPAGSGGDGGGEDGVDGEPSVTGSPDQGGAGGSQTEGGAGGLGLDDGDDGTEGDGGAGGPSPDGDSGGGGGGGLFGGGGGAGGVDFSKGGPEDGAGAGGGSGFTPSGTGMETGVNEGDGFVEITYDPAAGTCPAVPAAVVVEPRFTG